MTIRRKGLTIATLFLLLILLTGCCHMSDTVKPIADDVFKKAALPEPLPPQAFTSDGCSLWFDGRLGEVLRSTRPGLLAGRNQRREAKSGSDAGAVRSRPRSYGHGEDHVCRGSGRRRLVAPHLFPLGVRLGLSANRAAGYGLLISSFHGLRTIK